MILKTKNNIELNNEKLKELKSLLRNCNINFKNVTFVRNKDLSWDKNLACFSILHPNTIYLAYDAPIFRLIPIIAHELIHRYQFFKLTPIVYLILAIPLWRCWTIEPSAYTEENRVDKLF